MSGQGARVYIEGLGDFRRALREMDRALPTELAAAMRAAAGPVARRAGEIEEARAKHPTGRLARSVRVYGRGATLSIGSRLPYAAAINWGGTTGPGHRRGVGGSGSVHIRGTRFVELAEQEKRGDFIDDIGDAIERFAHLHGF
jgi:phage gpG-like protein